MMTTHPTPQLDPTGLYLAGDRIVCGTIRCAGTTAVYTGHTRDGERVQPLEFAALELGWEWEADPYVCECGAVTYRDTHLSHPVDGLALCATAEDSPNLTDDPQAVTCRTCQDAL